MIAETPPPELPARRELAAPYAEEFPLGLGLYDEAGTFVTGEDIQGQLAPDQRILPAAGTTLVTAVEHAGDQAALLSLRQSTYTAVGASPLRDVVPSAMQARRGAQAGARTYIVGAESELLFVVGGPSPASLADHAGVQAALRGERGSSFLPMPDGEHVVAFAPIPSAGWGLIVEEPWETVSSSLLDLSLLAPFSLVPILLLALLGLWFGARRVIEPLRRLEEAAANLPDGDPEAIERPTGGIAEIEQLRASLARMTARVREAQTALRAYIGVITNAQEEERHRVARELHDESIQHWIALDQRLQMTANRLREEGVPEANVLTELHQQAQDGIKELRRLSRGLRPIYLEDLGLVPAIEMLARDTENSLGIPIRFEIVGEEVRLASEVELAVYRVVQEGLSNIARHANASMAHVALRFESENLEVVVEDNGRGFRPPEQLEALAASGHYGVMGMKERADALDGNFEIDSAPDDGTRIRLSVPVPAGQDGN